jgi:hypothetical protein
MWFEGNQFLLLLGTIVIEEIRRGRGGNEVEVWMGRRLKRFIVNVQTSEIVSLVDIDIYIQILMVKINKEGWGEGLKISTTWSN